MPGDLFQIFAGYAVVGYVFRLLIIQKKVFIFGGTDDSVTFLYKW